MHPEIDGEEWNDMKRAVNGCIKIFTDAAPQDIKEVSQLHQTEKETEVESKEVLGSVSITKTKNGGQEKKRTSNQIVDLQLP